MPSQDSEVRGSRHLATHSRRRRYSFDGDVLDAAQALIASRPDWSPVQIWRHLDRQPELAGRVPTQRTITRLITERTPKDSPIWRLEDADGDDAALVLPVLATVLRRLEGRVLQLTRDEAEWVIRLRRATPDIPLWASYQIARMYLSNKAADLPTEFIDRIVATAPWRDTDTYPIARAGVPQISPYLRDQLTDRSHEESNLNG